MTISLKFIWRKLNALNFRNAFIFWSVLYYMENFLGGSMNPAFAVLENRGQSNSSKAQLSEFRMSQAPDEYFFPG